MQAVAIADGRAPPAAPERSAKKRTKALLTNTLDWLWKTTTVKTNLVRMVKFCLHDQRTVAEVEEC